MRDPSSLKLRRDKVYLLDCLSRRNAMKPEAQRQQGSKYPAAQSKTHSQIYCTIAAGALNYPPQKRQKKDSNQCELI